ncbi:hypothetical protein Taro_047744 [Colocasia esculenta]|uniref:DUF4283 domain-containing protein n=1 Tax=Colocasia esculenta TaxID=4460 RepID=A0A843WWU3_COLES|nr:hypothetical protein [Colocasia esculenta]
MRVVIEVVLFALAHQGVAAVFTPCVAESVLHVSGRESPSVGPVSSRAVGAAVSGGESFLLAVVLLWPLVHLGCTLFTFGVCAPGACDSTLCCVVCLFVCFVHCFTSLLSVGGFEFSASRTRQKITSCAIPALLGFGAAVGLLALTAAVHGVAGGDPDLPPSSARLGRSHSSCSIDGGPTPGVALSHDAATPHQKSFAQILMASVLPSTLPIKVHSPACTDSGEPATFFSLEEVRISCAPFNLAIIACTPVGRPSFQEIRVHLAQRFSFVKDFIISALDGRHLLLRFQDKEDYLKVLLKDTLFVKGYLFRFFQWSMDFSPDEDSSLIPVWVEMPGLPANFYNEPMLKSIAGSLGQVLQAPMVVNNNVTSTLLMPSDKIVMRFDQGDICPPFEIPIAPTLGEDGVLGGDLVQSDGRALNKKGYGGISQENFLLLSKLFMNLEVITSFWKPMAESPVSSSGDSEACCLASTRPSDLSALGVAPVGRGLIAARLAVAIRVAVATWFPIATGRMSRRAALSHQGYCRGALPRRDGIATACGGATVPVLPRVVSVASLCVGMCPRAGFALRTFWLSLFPGTPVLENLLREYSGLRACSIARACTVFIARLCLVSVGVVGLALGRPVLLVVPASVFSRFRGPVLGCQPMMAPACVASRPGGVCAEHCFCFVPDSIGFCGSRFLLLWPLGARRCGSSVSDGLQRRLWRRVVVSSSESERCELLYPSLFSVPKRDRGARRILIATPGDVAFWLPPFWLVVCMRAACRARDGHADVDRRLATGSRVATWSRRSDTSHRDRTIRRVRVCDRDMSRCRDLIAAQAPVAITVEGGALALVVLLGNAAHMVSCKLTRLCSVAPSVVTSTVGSPRFRGEPGTWECSGFVQVQWYRQGLVIFLDTLTLEESCVVVWLVSIVLVWFSGAAAGPFVRGCETER